MATLEFDNKFQELFTEIVEKSFDYVNRNDREVNKIYIYASTENNIVFYNVFYQINNVLVKTNMINSVSTEQYDLSDNAVFGLLKSGKKSLKNIMKIFNEDEREVPTLMKMTYEPKTGAFNNDIIYELQYSNHATKTNVDCFNEWFEEEKNKL